jgi:hypothetical protein
VFFGSWVDCRHERAILTFFPVCTAKLAKTAKERNKGFSWRSSRA